MTPKLQSIGPQTVQALRRDLNRYAHALFVLYGRIEQAMHGKTNGIDAQLSESAGSECVVKAIVRKLREDGFTVRAIRKRGQLPGFRILWKKLSDQSSEGQKALLKRRGTR